MKQYQKFINIILYSPINSFFIFLITILSGFTSSLLALALFPLTREISIEIDPDFFILRYYDATLNYFNIENSIGIVLCFMVLTVIIGAIINIIFDLYSQKVSTQINSDLKLDLFNKILKSKWVYFVEKKPGEIINAIFVETSKTVSAYRDILECFSFFSQFLFYALISIIISTQVTLLTIAIGIMIVLIFSIWNKKSKRSGLEFNNINKIITSKILDSLKNFKTIKATGRSQYLTNFLYKDFIKLKKAEYNLNTVLIYPRRLVEPIVVFFLAVGVYMIFKYEFLYFGELLPMIYIYQRTIAHLTAIQGKYQSLKSMESFYDSYMSNLETVKLLEENFKGSESPKTFNRIEFKNINFAYNDKIIFDNANLSINKGTLNLIYGSSGIGKTTLLDLVCQILEIKSGEFLIDSKNINKIDINKWREKIGYVTQEDTFYNDTLRNNICFGEKNILEDDIKDALRISCSLDIIDKQENGLETNIGEGGSKLSGGQRQRLSIARAFIKKPLILILDEATNSLDQDTKNNIMKNLKKEVSKGLTIILTTHDKELLQYADNLIEINNYKVNLVTTR